MDRESSALIFCRELRPPFYGLRRPTGGSFASPALPLRVDLVFRPRKAPIRFGEEGFGGQGVPIFRRFLLAMAEGCNPAPSPAC
jgi:hypothetical protein